MRSWRLFCFPIARKVRTSSWLVRSKLVQELRSKLVQELRSKLVLELVQVRSKLELVQVQELRSKLVLELVLRSRLELLRRMLVLVRSKRSLPCGNRTNRLR